MTTMRSALRLLLSPALLIAAALGLAVVDLFASNDEPTAEWVGSVQPFYTSQDLTTDVALAGDWHYGEEVTLTFTPTNKGSYKLVLRDMSHDKPDTYTFDAHLFHLGVDSFLDLYPTSLPESAEVYVLFSVPCHVVAKVSFPDDRLQLIFLNAGWLADQSISGNITISHIQTDGLILFTATTEEMQELLYLNATNEDAFNEHIEFGRTEDSRQDPQEEAQ